MSSDGSNEQQVTNSPALDALPAYSPNGRSIVFESDRGAKNNRDLYSMDAQGGDQHRLFADSRLWDVAPSWGPAYGTGRCTISGTIHADVLVGTSANDVICGGAGNDTIYARDGHRDVVDGGPGRDVAHVDRKLDHVTNVEVKRYR
jgi:Ca2+-binding RTX toxin-like protein